MICIRNSRLTATAIFNVQHERTWRVDGRPWTERNKEAFSGVHNFMKRVIIFYDECAMIPESIWEATDGMLNDAERKPSGVSFRTPPE